MTGGSGPSGRSARSADSVRLGAGVPRAQRSDPGAEELCAICFGCGLERTDSPLGHRDRLMACLVCGETRMIIDVSARLGQRPARRPPIEPLPTREPPAGRPTI